MVKGKRKKKQKENKKEDLALPIMDVDVLISFIQYFLLQTHKIGSVQPHSRRNSKKSGS